MCSSIALRLLVQAVKRSVKRLAQTFEMTKFAGVPMIPVAARPGSQEGAVALGVDALKVGVWVCGCAWVCGCMGRWVFFM